MNAKIDAENLVNELTTLLMDGGCVVNKKAIIDLAIYILDREKSILDMSMKKLEGVLDDNQSK